MTQVRVINKEVVAEGITHEIMMLLNVEANVNSSGIPGAIFESVIAEIRPLIKDGAMNWAEKNV